MTDLFYKTLGVEQAILVLRGPKKGGV